MPPNVGVNETYNSNFVLRRCTWSLCSGALSVEEECQRQKQNGDSHVVAGQAYRNRLEKQPLLAKMRLVRGLSSVETLLDGTRDFFSELAFRIFDEARFV